MKIEKHNLMIVIIVLFGCLVTLQALMSVEELDLGEAGIPLWDGSWRDELPEKYRVYRTLKGRLSQEIFPVPWFGPAVPVGENQTVRYLEVMVLEVLDLENVTTKYYLWYGGRTGMILARSGGNTVIGGAIITEWTMALKEGNMIEIEGYAFDVIAEGKRYTLLNVDRVDIEDSLELETEPAWIMASKLSVNVANETPIVNITSQDLNRLSGLAKAIERVFEEEMMKKQGIIVTPSDRIRKISREQGIAIVRFLEGEMTQEKTTYGFFVIYAGDAYSIYIQFVEQPQITS